MPQNNKIKIRRGLDVDLPLPNTEEGELRYSKDTQKLYIDDGINNVYIGGNTDNFPISTATQTALNGKEPIIPTGTALQYIKGDKTLGTFPTIPTVDQTIIDGSTNAVSGNAVFDALATKAPISSVHNPVTIGTANGLSLSTQQLSLGLASSGVTGALSGTDWNTFNGKFNTPTGLTTNYLPKWNGSGFGDSKVYDNGAYFEYLGEGSTPSINVLYNGSSGFPLFQLRNIKSGIEKTWNIENGRSAHGDLGFFNSGGQRVTITDTGNTLFGKTDDNGVDKLQVNGSGSFSGGLRIPLGQLFLTGSEGDANFMRIVSTPTSSFIQYAAGTTGGSRGRLAFTGLYGGNETMVLNGDGSVNVNGNITATPAVSPNQVVVKSQLDAAFSSGEVSSSKPINVSNVTTVTQDTYTYTKIGNIVTCRATFSVVNTTTNSSVFEFNLPFNRVFGTGIRIGSGTWNVISLSLFGSASVYGSTISTARISFNPNTSAGSTHIVSVNFQYSINQ